MLSNLRSLLRTVWLVGLISLVNDSASERLYLFSVLMAGPLLAARLLRDGVVVRDIFLWSFAPALSSVG